MRNTFKSVLVISALLVGGASATQGSTTTTTQASASAQAELRAAVLLDARGRVVGTLDKMGRLVASGAVHTATQVRVAFESGASKTFTLAKKVEASSRVTLETIVVKSGQASTSLEKAVKAELGAHASTQANIRTNVEATAQASLHAAKVLHGKTVTLVSATGEIVGTFKADGSLHATGDIRKATDVVVTLESGKQVSYDLASSVTAGASGMLKVESVNVHDQDRAVALVSVLVQLEKNLEIRGGTSGEGKGQVSGGASGSGSTSGNGSAGGSASGEGSTSGGISIGVGVGGGIGIGIGGKGK